MRPHARLASCAARTIVVIVLVVVAERAHGEPISPLARQLSEQGRALHDVGEYDQAIVAYKQAYVISPSPGLLFNMAQAYRLAGDCASAAMLYRRFLEQSRDAEAARVAHRQLAAVEPCAIRVAAIAAERAAAEPAVTATVVPPRRGEIRAGVIVAGGGVVALAVGAYFAIDARDASDQVAAAYAHGGSWKDVEPIDARGRRAGELAVGSFVVGGAAVVTGAVLYALGHRDAERGPAITATPAGRGAAVGLSWRF